MKKIQKFSKNGVLDLRGSETARAAFAANKFSCQREIILPRPEEQLFLISQFLQR